MSRGTGRELSLEAVENGVSLMEWPGMQRSIKIKMKNAEIGCGRAGLHVSAYSPGAHRTTRPAAGDYAGARARDSGRAALAGVHAGWIGRVRVRDGGVTHGDDCAG